MSRSFARPDVFAATYMALLAEDAEDARRQANTALRAICLASGAALALTLVYFV